MRRPVAIPIAIVLAVAVALVGCGTDPPGATGPGATSDPSVTTGPAAVSTTATAPSTGTSATSTAPPSTTPSAPEPTPTPIACGRPGALQHFTYASEVMRNVHPTEGYYVYTPPCFDRSRTYPVAYLFHGAPEDESQWLDTGIVDTANALMSTGEVAPGIIVLGDGMYAQGDYTAPPGYDIPFDHYVLAELLPRVEAAFPVSTERDHRAIGGISRGGEWALLVASRHPDAFGAVGGHSPAVGSPTNPGAVLGPELAGKDLRIRLDVGTSDSLLANVRALDDALTARDVPHELHTSAGGHTIDYWKANVPDYLRFYFGPAASPSS